jgi:SNF2 family DNA or RNA helicase
LGKTSISLAAIKILKKKKLIDKVLLIAPLRVCHNVWPAEVKKWEDFHGLTISVLHGPRKDERLNEEADIYVINPEGLPWLLQSKMTKVGTKSRVTVDMRRWKKLGFDTLIVDELTKFKHTNTTRFKALKLVLHTFRRRWGLTGSPAPNGLLDLFGQCYVIDQGRTLGKFVTHYRANYFNPSYDGFGWVLRDGADQEIFKRLSPLALRMSASDYLDMPKLIENNIFVELPDDARGVYDALENDLIANLSDKVVTAVSAAVASMKCRQIASGGIYLDPDILELIKKPKTKRGWIKVHDEKTNALCDLVDELQGSPLLVAYEFTHDIERIREKLGDVPYIGGGVSQKVSTKLVDKWNRGEIPVLLGHPQAIGHGLNLQDSGHHVCWYSPTWDYELYDQFIRRVLRQGNKSKVVFTHHIMAAGTIDEAVLAALKTKRAGQNALFEALKKLRRRG